MLLFILIINSGSSKAQKGLDEMIEVEKAFPAYELNNFFTRSKSLAEEKQLVVYQGGA